MATGINLANFTYAGTAQLDGVLGSFQADGPVQINRLSINAQTPATGGNVVVGLFDEDGVELGRVTMMSASSFSAENLAALITLARGDIVTAKFIEVDGGVASFFTFAIIGATAEYPTGPCCCGPCGNAYAGGYGYGWGGWCC